jgi:hypothetical protein
MQWAGGFAQTSGKEPEGTATSAAGSSNPILPSRSYRRASKQGRMAIFLKNVSSNFLLNKQVKTT